ncbi:LysR family transcriptional regulator [Algivirga pacifica]|uniref:LysR family transcriptional regulator n=1 Tax=Algivirga pacifica TaxID=1162670 RepID=A0ABP9DI92_9BACT
MNLQFVKYFVALSETGNFTKAAEKMHVVQSAFSTGIKKLEEQVNCQLFVRDKKQVTLTYEGKQLLPKAKQLLTLWSDMETTFTNQEEKILKIGVVNELDFSTITSELKRFQEIHTQYQIEITEGSLEELLDALKRHEIHGIFTKTCISKDPLVEVRLLREDPLFLGVPEHHPLAKEKKISLNVLDGANMIKRHNCAFFNEVDGIFQQSGVTPNFIFQANSDDVAKALIASGVGMSLIPTSPQPYPGIKYIPVNGISLNRPIYFLWNKEHVSKGLEKFLY